MPSTERRGSRLLLLFSLTMLLAAGGCSKKAATSATPQAAATPTPKQRLDNAADRMQALPAFHFLLTHENGASTISFGLKMTRAEGDFQKPDRFRASVVASLQGFPVAVKVINVGDQTWITNPLQGGDQYQPLPNGTQATAIFDPNTGILHAARDVSDPKLTGTDKISGVDTLVVQGTIDAGELTSVATDAQQGHQVAARVWIGKADSLVYRIRLEGPFSDSEPKNIARQIETSQFNEKIDIRPPS